MKIASGGPKVGVAVPPLGKSWGGTCPRCPPVSRALKRLIATVIYDSPLAHECVRRHVDLFRRSVCQGLMSVGPEDRDLGNMDIKRAIWSRFASLV